MIKNGNLKSRKTNAYFFSLSISDIAFFNYSDVNSSIFYTNREECVEVFFDVKIHMWKDKNYFIYGKKNSKVQFLIKNSLKYSHLGDINSILWHPYNDNLAVSCGDDAKIHIWHYVHV